MILNELERRTPNVYIRPVYGEVAGLAPEQLLELLQNYEAFAPTPYANSSS
ncbi:MAG TPA: hypothetical protein VNN80_12190 [Polyangiaceae bacterium]|nr:hypothetical protein [Polyangiaceae bacterium]